MPEPIPPQDPPPGAGDYLTVSLDDDLFAIAVERVHEVLDPPAMTRVPNAPDFAPGLVNVRGTIVPLVDLRRRLGMPAGADTEHTRVVVTRIQAGPDGFLVALKADAVHEVVALPPNAVDPVPDNGTRWPPTCLAGVAKHNNRFVLILNLQTITQNTDSSVSPSLH